MPCALTKNLRCVGLNKVYFHAECIIIFCFINGQCLVARVTFKDVSFLHGGEGKSLLWLQVPLGIQMLTLWSNIRYRFSQVGSYIPPEMRT